jgi:hypothetical protein
VALGLGQPPPLSTGVIQPIPLPLHKLTEHPGLVLETEYCEGSQPELIWLLRQIIHEMNRSVSGF